MSSFYICVPKIMIRWCMVPEIWRTTDGQADRWTDWGKKWHIEVGAPPKNNAQITVFLIPTSIRQMPMWLLTWKTKSLFHIDTFLSTLLFLPLQKFKTIKIKQEKNPYTQANMCLLHISRNFKDIFKYICFTLYL